MLSDVDLLVSLHPCFYISLIQALLGCANFQSKFGIIMISVLLQVALVYPNSDPVSYICAFYGCVTAGLVPVPVEVPTSKRVCTYLLNLPLYALSVCLLTSADNS